MALYTFIGVLIQSFHECVPALCRRTDGKVGVDALHIVAVDVAMEVIVFDNNRVRAHGRVVSCVCHFFPVVTSNVRHKDCFFVMPTDVMTMCFSTRDAIHRDKASFTFRMPSDRLRTDAVKVALASCEFPMVQWTIEEEWNRMYMNEGISFEDPEHNFLTLVHSSMREPVCLRLPVRLNPVTVARRGAYIVVACQHPHGADALVGSKVGMSLLGGVEGTIGILSSHVECTDERTLRVRTSRSHVGIHTLYTPNFPSPTSMCDALTRGARHALRNAGEDDESVRFSFSYDNRRDVIRVSVTHPQDDQGMVRLFNTPLLVRLGISSMPVRMSGTRTTIPSEETGLWDYVTIPQGFYGPCHRPMCTGQPMRFGSEVETAVNRLYLPIVKSNGEQPPHQLVFSDPDGRVYTCTLPSGRYTPDTICRYLETEMTRIVPDDDVSYTVMHNDDRFSFSCERTERDGTVHSAPFGILFHHPLCLDAERLGFPSQPLSGSDTYVAPEPTRCAKSNGRFVHNIIRVSEISCQKRFRVHVTAPPPMIGQVVTVENGGELGNDVVRMRTHVNRAIFAHGYQVGDVVSIAACGETTVLAEEGDEQSLVACEASLPSECHCLVVESQSDDVSILALRIPPIRGIGDVNVALQITSVAAPWNLCTSRANSIPPELIGFRRGTTEWGIDGSVADMNGDRRPPFDAPNVHCLDHPDYVLITFSETSGAALEHSYDNENKQIFCKLSLYPLFREERMLPRDSTLMRGNLSTFTISFWNPDLRTPYCFHGSEFSFSLNFISALPD